VDDAVKRSCPSCGFTSGQKVKMMSGATKSDTGEPFGIVHGEVVRNPNAKCHSVTWKETGLITYLPNPNVGLDAGPS
jgi:hypothetical protein